MRRLGVVLICALAACHEAHVTAPPTGDGTLAISIVGLPTGASTTVRVNGNGSTQTLTGSTEVALPAGSYSVNVAAVQVAGTNWYPNTSSQSVVIGSGDRRVVKFRYGRVPVAGMYVSALELFDSAMVAYMTARNIGAGTLTVSRQGQEIYRRAFGWRDSARTQMLAPNAMMRLASNTKPVTAAAIRKLVSQGLLTLNTKAFAFLGLAPAGTVIDARIYDITVQHLLDHTGGWNRTVAGDFLFRSRDISRALDITTPPSETQIAQWAMTQPLQQTPGTATLYSNFGYLLLGLVVEKVTGQPFVDYVKQNIFASTVAAEVIAGRSLRADRDAREPFYSDPFKGCSVFFVDTCVLVPWPDGGWYIESFDACGGLVASAPALASFLNAYWINGQPRLPGNNASFVFFGAMDGTFTMSRQRGDGANLVALFNQRTDPSGLAYDDIQQILDDVADRLFPAAIVANKR